MPPHGTGNRNRLERICIECYLDGLSWQMNLHLRTTGTRRRLDREAQPRAGAGPGGRTMKQRSILEGIARDLSTPGASYGDP